ncbi:MAG: carbohydrate ABC transporter permease [Armatimonadetes bacterium]|nr:carbohydrate ABC transporter permease [Armatimonadota bacterium]
MMKRVLRVLVISVFLISVLLPFLWVIYNSFKPGWDIISNPWALPSSPRWENYVNAWTKAQIGSFFMNSLLISTATMVILIPVSAMAAYVLAKFPFRGSGLIYGGFLSGMMVPQFLTIVPLVMLTQQMHLFDSKLGLVAVYVAFSLPFTIFVLYGFFQTLPDEMLEAATLDGASDASAFWKVMLPLARPGLLVALIFNAIGLWNEYNLALVLVPSPENSTLPLGIARLTTTQQYQSDWGALFAGMVIVMAPVMVLYWMFRDKVHESMLAGAIKG